ncbi:TonB-dependent receptor [Gloeobacter violaceus]|uniref:Gll3601 protein n=1 Tax=Gloeobacter violaceus (strain ATCC 29082 / PCC 7421) TaxID=251221 RepID=Q7NFC5_GLOVI|nr:TonB-dependent receptor [Gloeobacter violaceus]BAC91542.1 gll3601 [Gloeobacter violaceus PCC 7421]
MHGLFRPHFAGRWNAAAFAWCLVCVPVAPAAEVPHLAELERPATEAGLLTQQPLPEPPSKAPAPGSTPAEPVSNFVLEDVNVTANRRTQSDLSTPLAITVIPKEEIDRRRARATTIADLLNTVPNFSQSFTGGRFISQPRLRGGLGGRGSQSGLLILVDGIRRNNTNGTEDYLLDFPVDQIERIEVIRGAASVLYGTEAVDGVINLITRRGVTEQTARLSANFDFGSSETFRTGIGLSGKAGNLRYLTRFSSQNVGDYLDATGKTQVRNRFDSQNYLARLTYEFDNKSELEFEFLASRTQNLLLPIVSDSGAVFDFSFPYRNRDQYAFTYRNANLLGSEFQARLYYTGFERNFRNNIFLEAGPGALIPTSLQDQRPILTSLGGIAQFVSTLGAAKLTWGLDAYNESYSNNDTELTGGVADSTPQRPSGSQRSIAPFAQAAVPIAAGLNLTAGLRWDNYRQAAQATALNPVCPLPFLPPGVPCPFPLPPDSFPGNVRETSELIPAAGLTWEFAPGYALRASYGRAIRNPNFFELYGGPQSVGVTLGNPGLTTERSETYDIGIRVRQGRLRADIGYFLSNFDNKIVAQALPEFGGLVLLPANIRRVQGYGYEAEASWEIVDGLTVFGSYGTVTAYDQDTGTRIGSAQGYQLVPASASIGLRFQERSGFYAQAILRNVPSYFATAPAGQGNGFTVLDFDLGVPLSGATRLGIGVTNLTDALYREPFTTFNAPGAQIFASLATEF